MSQPLSEALLAEIRSRHAAATRGPWRWFGHGGRKHKQIDLYLATAHSGRLYVMDFARSGMDGAQPRFRDQCTHLMVAAREVAVYEVPYRDDVVGIANADAQAIARSWEDIDALLREVDRLRALVAERGG